MFDQFKNKKHVSVCCPNAASPLTYPDLLVYWFRAYQHRFNTVPSLRRTAKATGLREATVASSTERLSGHGLLTPDAEMISPCPHPEWFNTLDGLRKSFPEGPNYRWFQNWKSYVRRPGEDNPLTVPCVMIYSVIRHSVSKNWKPVNGWSQEYLALLTGTSAKTVGTSLDKLQELGFLTVMDGMRFKLFQLRPEHLSCFADKQEWSANSCEPDELVGEFSPVESEWGRDLAIQFEIGDYVKPYPLQEEQKDKIVKLILAEDGWQKHWKGWADQLITKFLQKA